MNASSHVCQKDICISSSAVNLNVRRLVESPPMSTHSLLSSGSEQRKNDMKTLFGSIKLSRELHVVLHSLQLDLLPNPD